MKHPFTDEELLMIFEALRVALCDEDIFDAVADAMDIQDDELYHLDVKLVDFMNRRKENK